MPWGVPPVGGYRNPPWTFLSVTPLETPGPPGTLLGPSFPLSCPWAGPAAEAARASFYN